MNFFSRFKLHISLQQVILTLLVAAGAVFIFQCFTPQVLIDDEHTALQRDHEHHVDQHYEDFVPMDAEQIAQSGIALATAGPASITTSLQLTGEAKLNADRMVYVVPRLAGLVESVHVSAGDAVQRGQVLAVLSSQSLADQRSTLQVAQKRLSLSSKVYQREKELWQEGVSAEQDYLQAEHALREDEIALQAVRQKLAALGGGLAAGDLTRYQVRAPINGVVTEKQVAAGQVVSEDSNIFTVADLSTVWVEMQVHSQDLEALHVGQEATVRSSVSDFASTGTIDYIGAVVGTASRTAVARLQLANPDTKWRPGVPVIVSLAIADQPVALAVTADSVHELQGQQVVFVHRDSGFSVRPLRLGRRDKERVEVLAGLQPEEQYATTNSFIIKAELGKAGLSHEH